MEPSTTTSRNAQDRFAELLTLNDRVLVTGATGWFGRTALALVLPTRCEILATASRPRTIQLEHNLVDVVSWDLHRVREFQPTIVLDCAFLTRDRVEAMSLTDYIRINQMLTSNLLQMASMGSVNKVVTISSGAAVYPDNALLGNVEDNPYGWLKARAEVELAGISETSGRAAVVARAWSVSGAFVQRPGSYALSDMVLQAATGRIRISSAQRVYRRYVSVEDLLAVSLSVAGNPTFQVIDSGGTLVEMADLAEVVRAVVNPSAIIERASIAEGREDHYYSDGLSWAASCTKAGYRMTPIAEQVRIVRGALLGP